LTHGYRTLQHWDQWLTQNFLGNQLVEAERKVLKPLLDRHFGKHSLLIGVPHQHELFSATTIPYHSLISPLFSREKKINYIEGDFQELPILTGSIDLMFLPHTLEFVDNPRQLLAEACRVIKPEGLIAICGFNPYSMWGIKKILAKSKKMPWSGSFIQAQKVKNWLKLADFALEKETTTLFRPPVASSSYEKLHLMERVGAKCFPKLGGVYILLARAKVIPLTPIRLKWKQQLSSIQISTSISGHIARQSK